MTNIELKKHAIDLILQLTDDETNVLMEEFKKYRENRMKEADKNGD
ncbi:MAG: hypothetical protein LUD55_08100 [Oscillospiraceae bacterium]|nr:hypothetical protein [Oscillospiraceae bacterium]